MSYSTIALQEGNPIGDHAMADVEMNGDVMAFRVVTATIGFVLIGKLLFDYFSGSPRVVGHPDPRVRRLNRLRVYSIIVCFVSIGVATFAGLPFTGVLVIFGIAVAAALVCFVCTIRVILITGQL